jgi:hypothetical protein
MVSSKLFGEDDEAVDEEELDKAKAEGENGASVSNTLNIFGLDLCLSLTRRSRGDRQSEERGRCIPRGPPGVGRRGRSEKSVREGWSGSGVLTHCLC